MGTDMMLAAEAHNGEPTDFKIEECWQRVDALFALKLIESYSNNPILRRELTHMTDTFLQKHNKQLPGLVMWIVIARNFQTSKSLEI